MRARVFLRACVPLWVSAPCLSLSLSLSLCVCVCVCVCAFTCDRAHTFVSQEMHRVLTSPRAMRAAQPSAQRHRDVETRPAQRPQRVIAEADFERVLVRVSECVSQCCCCLMPRATASERTLVS